jgi:hypothetical protein
MKNRFITVAGLALAPFLLAACATTEPDTAETRLRTVENRLSTVECEAATARYEAAIREITVQPSGSQHIDSILQPDPRYNPDDKVNYKDGPANAKKDRAWVDDIRTQGDKDLADRKKRMDQECGRKASY